MYKTPICGTKKISFGQSVQIVSAPHWVSWLVGTEGSSGVEPPQHDNTQLEAKLRSLDFIPLLTASTLLTCRVRFIYSGQSKATYIKAYSYLQ